MNDKRGGDFRSGGKRFGQKNSGPGGGKRFVKRFPGGPASGEGDGPKKYGKPKFGGKPKSFSPKPALSKPAPRVAAEATSWEHVAPWYDNLVGDEGSDYHRHVLLPATLRLLATKPSDRVLDLCCGQGVLCRLLADKAAEVVGVDVSPSLIASARERTAAGNVRFAVADARKLDAADVAATIGGPFDAAACVMALHDVDDLAGLLRSLAGCLKPGGRSVVVIMHPCFRVPRQSSWGWDDVRKTQFRRTDRYMTELNIPIATHPGIDPNEHTSFFHRPLSTVLTALGAAGLATTACEELTGHRQSEPGPRAKAENRARQEIPIFLAIHAVKSHVAT